MTNETRFWLMTGDVPGGPFTLAQLQLKLSKREISRQLLACPLGSNKWRPIGDFIAPRHDGAFATENSIRIGAHSAVPDSRVQNSSTYDQDDGQNTIELT